MPALVALPAAPHDRAQLAELVELAGGDGAVVCAVVDDLTQRRGRRPTLREVVDALVARRAA